MVATVSVGLVATACGSSDERWTEPPEGRPALPDFSPLPPRDIHTKIRDGVWTVEFSSMLLNIGSGDFHLTADREGDVWQVTQDIQYTEAGAEHRTLDVVPVWAGDGHEHWHLPRVVEYRLVPAEAPSSVKGRIDSKIGFCVYDFGHELEDTGPRDGVYGRDGCGKEDSDHLVMGLSPGWVDTYEWSLPGQSIEITGLADGDYRITAEADRPGAFHEETRDNNATWVDFTLSTKTDGTRLALVTEVGPTHE